MTSKGITLIELLITIAVIGVIAAIAMPVYNNYLEEAEMAIARGDIQSIETAILRYEIAAGGLPDNLGQLNAIPGEDPWGNPYQYLNFENVKGKGKLRKDKNLVPINSDYDLYSMGPDGSSVSPLTAKASRDDIIRANNGEFIGKASEY